MADMFLDISLTDFQQEAWAQSFNTLSFLQKAGLQSEKLNLVKLHNWTLCQIRGVRQCRQVLDKRMVQV